MLVLGLKAEPASFSAELLGMLDRIPMHTILEIVAIVGAVCIMAKLAWPYR